MADRTSVDLPLSPVIKDKGVVLVLSVRRRRHVRSTRLRQLAKMFHNPLCLCRVYHLTEFLCRQTLQRAEAAKMGEKLAGALFSDPRYFQ